MKWGYLVRYRKDGRLKDKDFGFDEAGARAFYEQRRKYLEGALLVKYQPEGWLYYLKGAKVTWFGRQFLVLDILAIVGWTTALIILWRRAR